MLSWEQRIERAGELVTRGFWFWEWQERRGFTDEDVALAIDWATCSCGQADSRIPRDWAGTSASNNRGRPLDAQLSALGWKFYQAVENDEVDRAMVLYRKVQERAEQLVEEIEAAVVKKQEFVGEELVEKE